MKFVLAVTLAVALSPVAAAAPHPFDVNDLVNMERVSDPQLAPDGKSVLLQLRQTDYAANKGRSSIWSVGIEGGEPTRLTDAALNVERRALVGAMGLACSSSLRRTASASSGASMPRAAPRARFRRCRWTSATSSSRRTASACRCRSTCSLIAPATPT